MSTTISHRTGTRTLNIESDTEHDHALGPLHEPALGRVVERLGPGTLVRDQHRERGGGEREHREVRALAREVPGTPAEDDGVGDAVGDGVEERARGLASPLVRATLPSRRSMRPLATRPSTAQRSSPIAMSHAVMPEQSEADDGEDVGGDADPSEALAHGRERLADSGTEASVKHRCCSRLGRVRDPG